MDIYPYSQKALVKSSNTLINPSDTDIKQIFITSKKKLNDIKINGATLVIQKTTPFWNVYLLDLNKALKPDQETIFEYSLEMQSTAFSIDKGLTSDATYFHQGNFEPLLGYAKFMELEGDFQRTKYDLPVHEKSCRNKFYQTYRLW